MGLWLKETVFRAQYLVFVFRLLPLRELTEGSTAREEMEAPGDVERDMTKG